MKTGSQHSHSAWMAESLPLAVRTVRYAYGTWKDRLRRKSCGQRPIRSWRSLFLVMVGALRPARQIPGGGKGIPSPSSHRRLARVRFSYGTPEMDNSYGPLPAKPMGSDAWPFRPLDGFSR